MGADVGGRARAWGPRWGRAVPPLVMRTSLLNLLRGSGAAGPVGHRARGRIPLAWVCGTGWRRPTRYRHVRWPLRRPRDSQTRRRLWLFLCAAASVGRCWTRIVVIAKRCVALSPTSSGRLTAAIWAHTPCFPSPSSVFFAPPLRRCRDCGSLPWPMAAPPEAAALMAYKRRAGAGCRHAPHAVARSALCCSVDICPVVMTTGWFGGGGGGGDTRLVGVGAPTLNCSSWQGTHEDARPEQSTTGSRMEQPRQHAAPPEDEAPKPVPQAAAPQPGDGALETHVQRDPQS